MAIFILLLLLSLSTDSRKKLSIIKTAFSGEKKKFWSSTLDCKLKKISSIIVNFAFAYELSTSPLLYFRYLLTNKLKIWSWNLIRRSKWAKRLTERNVKTGQNERNGWNIPARRLRSVCWRLPTGTSLWFLMISRENKARHLSN